MLACSLIGYGCGVQTNELPMYGNVQKTPEQTAIDETFIRGVTAEAGNKEAAAKKMLELVWQYAHRGDVKTAMKRCNQAWVLDPNNPEVFFGFGVLLSKQKKPDEAIKMYTKAIQLDPTYVDAYYNRGLDSYRQGKYDQAIADYSQALTLKPDDAQTYNDRAVAYFRTKDYDKSWEDVQKARALGYPVHPGFLKALRKASGKET